MIDLCPACGRSRRVHRGADDRCVVLPGQLPLPGLAASDGQLDLHLLCGPEPRPPRDPPGERELLDDPEG